MKECDVLVFGVGGVGSAVLYNLAKRGVKVVGVEKFDIAHDKGSSHGETRIIRRQMFENSKYLSLVKQSYDLWSILQKEYGKKLLFQNGILIIGDKNSNILRKLKKGGRHRLGYTVLSREEMKDLFPQFAIKENEIALYDSFGGYLKVEECIKAHISEAKKHGAKLFLNEEIEDWKEEKGFIRIKTNKREIKTKKLVITAGPWAKSELKKIGIKLKLLRKVVIWYKWPNMKKFSPEKFPVFIIIKNHARFYGFPAIGKDGIKIGEHSGGTPISNPATLNRKLNKNDQRNFIEIVNEKFPKSNRKLSKFSTCIYSLSPDGHFILDLHPKSSNVVIGAGFCGHGFKFSGVLGEILADLALEGKTKHDISIFRLNRFKENSNKLS